MIKEQRLLADDASFSAESLTPQANTNFPMYVFPTEGYSGRRWRNFGKSALSESSFNAFNSVSTYAPSPYALNSVRYQNNKSR
jgi:hypothetical protein